MKKPAAKAGEVAGDPVTVLAVGAGSGIEDLLRILGHSKWQVLPASTVSEAGATLRRGDPMVVVCEAALPDGTWKDVLDRALRLPFPTPVVVTASHADDYLWMEVLNLGGYNLLSKPFNEQEVFRILSMAWLRRRHCAQPRARANA